MTKKRKPKRDKWGMPIRTLEEAWAEEERLTGPIFQNIRKPGEPKPRMVIIDENGREMSEEESSLFLIT